MLKRLMFVFAALIGMGSAMASDIPPGAVTVVTTCGKPVVAYVTTHAGTLAYYGAPLAKIANEAPFNLRVETGCKR